MSAPPVPVRERPQPYTADFRRRLLRDGELAHLHASAATSALCDFVWGELCRTFESESPQLAQYYFTHEEYFSRLSRLRISLREHPAVRPLIRAMLEEFDCELDQVRCDFLRLRAVQSGGHRNPLAANAYLLHRDTWYANSEAQVNWWLAVRDIAAPEAPAFFPHHFQRPIENSSAGFDYSRWKELGSWQSPHSEKHFPTALRRPAGDEVRLSARCGDLWMFAGQHLHGTRPHDSGRTRFSLEVRVVHDADMQHHWLRNVDNQSIGDATTDYWRPL